MDYVAAGSESNVTGGGRAVHDKVAATQTLSWCGNKARSAAYDAGCPAAFGCQIRADCSADDDVQMAMRVRAALTQFAHKTVTATEYCLTQWTRQETNTTSLYRCRVH